MSSSSGGHKQRHAARVGKQARRKSYKSNVEKLQEELEQKAALLQELETSNARLREREECLKRTITAQGDNLHFVACAAVHVQQTYHRSTVAADLAATLCEDLQVYEMLNSVGCFQEQQVNEPYTTQRMRAAVTPERVQMIQAASVEQVVDVLRTLTMRMFHLMHITPSKAEFMAATVEDVVDQYVELFMLLHAAADRLVPEIAAFNMEVMCQAEPPATYYDRVLQKLNLAPEQRQALSSAFELYLSQSQPLIAEWHRLARRMHGLVRSDDLQQHQQQQQQQQQRDAAAACTAAAAASPSSSFTATNVCSPVAVDKPSSSSCGGGGSGSVSRSNSQQCGGKPWQHFGLPSGTLTVETAELLDDLMIQLLRTSMRMKEVHRNFIFCWINTLDRRQFAVSLVESYPFLARPLTICKNLDSTKVRHH